MLAAASPKRLPGLLPDLRQQQLPQACHALLAWQPAAGAAARKSTKQQQQEQQCLSAVGNVSNGMSSQGLPRGSSSSGVTTSAGRVALPGSSWHALPPPAAAAAGNQAGSPVQFVEAVWITPAKTTELAQQQQQQQQQVSG
jgi:hypothetical protein